MRTRAALLALALVSPLHATDRPLSAYISGGVGLEERAAMRPHEAEFNLRLLFALSPSGQYLSAVHTLVADERGEILLRVDSEGPFVWMRLAPGTYSIAVTVRGQTQNRRVTLDAGRAAVIPFYWKDR